MFRNGIPGKYFSRAYELTLAAERTRYQGKTVPFLPEGNRRLIVSSFLIHQTQTLEGDVGRVSVSHLTLAFCTIFHLRLPSFCCLFSDKHQRSDKEQCSAS